MLGLEITTVINVLKWDSQCPKSIQALAISINLLIYSLLLMIVLIWLHVNLSEPGANKLLHFSIALISSSLENGAHSTMALSDICLENGYQLPRIEQNWKNYEGHSINLLVQYMDVL